MSRLFLSVAISLLLSSAASAQRFGYPPRCYGGSGTDAFLTAIRTSDGGMLALGVSTSDDGDAGKFQHGKLDLFAVKFTTLHTVQWKTVLGGEDNEFASSVVQLGDDSYIIAGYTQSTSGDVTDPILNLDQVKKATTDSDIWLIHLSPAGTIVWNRTMGGSGEDAASALVIVNGSILIAGSTTSRDGMFASTGSAPGHAWAAMLDDSGRTQWVKRYGGSRADEIASATYLSSGTYVLAGRTESVDGDVTGNHLSSDFWLLSINDTGRLLWQQSLGDSNWDQANSVVATRDGNFVAAGWSAKDQNDDNVYIVKEASDGSNIWTRTYGGSQFDRAQSIAALRDGGFVFAGYTNSNDGNVRGLHNEAGSGWDFWIGRVDGDGSLEWQSTAGGSEDDVAYAIVPESDSSFLITGYTTSDDGDVVGDSHGGLDAWVVELLAPSSTTDGVATSSAQDMLRVNTARGRIAVQYDLSEPSLVKVELFDIMGRARTLREEQWKTPGAHHDQFDVGELPSGNYFLRITIEGKTITRAIRL